MFEIAAHGLPAILVPYPHATADHQRTNAALDGARRARRVVIADAELSRRGWRARCALARRSGAAGGDGGRRSRVARPQAAAEVAAELLRGRR